MRRERGVAVWVGPRSKSAALREECEVLRGAGVPAPQITAPNKTRHRTGMDITWLDGTGDTRIDRIAVGGGIWSSDNMAKVAEEGITHIIDMQVESDDRKLVPPRDPAGPSIEVLWLLTHDDFEPKRAALFRRGVRFAKAALAAPEAKLFIHCAAGVHRAPMMALAVLGSMGWDDLEKAMQFIEGKRPVVDFADVYRESVERFLAGK